MVSQYPWLSYYPDSVPAAVDLPTTSLAGLLTEAVHADPKAIATSFFGAKLTYGELLDHVLRLADQLRRLGVKRGDRVAIILPNCPQHLIAFYAIMRLGAVAVEHNPLYTPRELRHMFEDHTARIAICWDVAVPKLREQPEDIELDHIIAVNLTEAMPASKRFALRLPLPGLHRMRRQLTAKAPRTIKWRDVVSGPRLRQRYPQAGPDELAVIQYTSGTTAAPKGVMLTHRNLYVNALQARAWLIGLEEGQETVYAVLPLFHSFGMTLATTFGILMRAKIVLFPTFDPAMVLSEARHRPPTVLGGVPPMFAALAALATKRRVSLSHVKVCFSGAMALTAEVQELWSASGGGPIVEGYGLTEASPVCFGNPLSDRRRLGTIGVPFPNVEAKVVDADDPSRAVEPGQRGELLVRGPNIFMGYWHDSLETADALLPGGWLRTGDIVVMEPDGFTTVVDRKKELIITGGFNVAPTEVETVLLGEPSIADIAVVGLPDPRRGEVVVAAVILKPDMALNEKAIRSFAKERLAGYKVPRRVIAVDDLPKSLLGKVLRSQVRELLAAKG